jgi:enoyl-CoA hydratase/carnithine racemase
VEAWRNINAIEDVCETIVTCRQRVVAALTGGAGAGGVMMALGADRVIGRAGTVLNPYFASLGVSPSELRTATYAARAGDEAAERLLTACLPVSVTQARSAGLVDAVGPRDPDRFTRWAIGFANGLLSAGPPSTTDIDGPGSRAWRRNRRLRRLSSSAFRRIQLGEEPAAAPEPERERRWSRTADATPPLSRHRLARATHPHA